MKNTKVRPDGIAIKLKPSFNILVAALLGVLAIIASSGCEKKQVATSQSDTNTINGVSIVEFQRVAFWSGVLRQHPELPEVVKGIADGDSTKQTRQSDVEGVKVTIHSYLGPITVKATSISAIVTDIDGISLRKLVAYWQSIPERARELGIIPDAVHPRTPRVIVLGREGKVEIKGPKGIETQIVDVYSEPMSGNAAFEVHSFTDKGNEAIASILEHFRHANQTRGPPTDNERLSKYDLPRPENVPVVVIGKLKELSIEGGSGASEQFISFKEYINGYAATEPTKEVLEFAKTGESVFHAKTAAVTAAAAAAAAAAKKSYESRSSSSSERPYSGSSSGSGARRGGGARPGR